MKLKAPVTRTIACNPIVQDPRLQSNRVIRIRELCQLLGRGQTSIYADIKAGRLVAPLRVGPRAVGWLESDVEEHLAKLDAARRAACAPQLMGAGA